MRRTPLPHQRRGLGLLRDALLAGKRRPLLASSTGSGKTFMATLIVEGALSKNKRVVFTVPSLSLIDQTVSAFEREGIDPENIGVIQAKHPRTAPQKPIQVASVQTLANRAKPEADIVVVDEAHQVFRHMTKWMADPEWRSVPFVGLSATPGTRGLGKIYDELITVATTAELIKQGYLCPCRTFASAHPDLAGVRTVAGDFNEADLAAAMNKPQLVADVVVNWLQHAENRKTLVFAVNRAHAKALQKQFIDAGVRAGYVDAFTPLDERDAIGQQLLQGDLQVVVNIGTLTTGVDWPWVSAIVLARPTRSAMLFVQIVGRALRTAPGKVDAVLFDHSDTTKNLGLVTDIVFDRLDTGQKIVRQQKREILRIKECKQCGFVERIGTPGCTACGFKPERQHSVETVEGELRELGEQQVLDYAFVKAEHQRWYSAFLTMAKQRGHKHGWAWNSFKEKFAVAPGHLDERSGPIGQDVRNWITAKNIRFAKRTAPRRAS